MPIKLRQLAHAAALFRHGSFRRAAEAEHISQPALSRSIQSLEQSLGVLLFDRQAPEIAPTAFGQALLRRAETILIEAEEIEREMLLIQGLDFGALSLGMCRFPAELSGNRALVDLVRAHPKLQINVRLRHGADLPQLVHAREVDLGFGELAHLIDEPGLLVEPVARHELIFFSRPGHPLFSREWISLADLDAFPLVCAPVRATFAKLFPRNLRVDACGNYSLPSVRVESLTAIRAIVANTDAFSFATPVQLESLWRSGEIAAIPFRAPWLWLDYGFYHLASRSVSPAVGAFMTLVTQIERDLVEKNRLLVEQIFEGMRFEAVETGAIAPVNAE